MTWSGHGLRSGVRDDVGQFEAGAEAIADALGTDRVVPVHYANGGVGRTDLLVVGGPTHARGITTGLTRRMAVQAASESARPLDPEPARAPGLRQWLREIPGVDGRHAIAFDTRRDRSPLIAGGAARGIARRLRQRGYQVPGTASFLVEGSDGPLKSGELDRAREWAAGLAARVAETLAGDARR